MSTIALDKVLTYKEWGLHKNIIAALGSGNTGIGKALTTLEAEFKKVDWDCLDPTKTEAMTPRVLHEYRTAHQTKFKQATVVSAAAGQVAAAAAKAETALKPSKMIPDASKKYVTQIKDAAQKLRHELDGVPGLWDAAADKIRKRMGEHHQYLLKDIAKMQRVAEAAKKGDANAVKEFWKTFGEAVPFIRGLGHMGGSLAATDQVWKRYLEQNVFPVYHLPSEAKNLSTWVDASLKGLNGFAAIMQKE